MFAPPKRKIPSLNVPSKQAPDEDEEDNDSAEVVERPRKYGVPDVVVTPPSRNATLPAVIEPDPQDLSDEEVDANVESATKKSSVFGKKVSTIRRHIAGKDYASASKTAKESLLLTMVDLLPVAEASFRKSGAVKGTYQFMALTSAMQQILTDLDGERDLEAMVQSILDEAVHPTFLILAQQVIQFQAALKRRFRAELTPEYSALATAMLDEHVKELATYVQGMYSEVTKRVEKKVSGKAERKQSQQQQSDNG